MINNEHRETYTWYFSMYFKIPLHQLLASKSFLLLHPPENRHLVEATSTEGGFGKIQAVGNAAGEILNQTKWEVNQWGTNGVVQFVIRMPADYIYIYIDIINYLVILSCRWSKQDVFMSFELKHLCIGVIVGVVLPVRKWAAPNCQIHRTQKQREIRSFLSYFPPMACHWAVALCGTRGDLVSSTKSLKDFLFWHLDAYIYMYCDILRLLSIIQQTWFLWTACKGKNNIPLPSTYYLLLPHWRQL